jgi:hypothetical protein
MLTAKGTAESEHSRRETQQRWREVGATAKLAEGHPEAEISVEETPDEKRRPRWFKIDAAEFGVEAGSK